MFSLDVVHQDLPVLTHSFPTRRSSDLRAPGALMREYVPMFVVLDGDKQRAQQYVSIARTMLGRMKAYLGEGVDGVKTWTLGNGVSIRTLTAGGVDKVTIHAPHEEVTTRKGYYFVYLSGPLTADSANAYGWRSERD